MALSSDELSQIREVVRTELNQRRPGWRVLPIVAVLFGCCMMAVLLLHVLVIAGFTIWHLSHPA